MSLWLGKTYRFESFRAHLLQVNVKIEVSSQLHNFQDFWLVSFNTFNKKLFVDIFSSVFKMSRCTRKFGKILLHFDYMVAPPPKYDHIRRRRSYVTMW